MANQRREEKRQQIKQDRTHDGAGMAAAAAHDHHEQQLKRILQPKTHRVHGVVNKGVDHAGHTRQRRGDGVGNDLGTRHMHAHGLCGLGVVAYGATGATEPRAVEPPDGCQGAQHQQHDHHRVPGAADTHPEHVGQAVIRQSTGAAGDLAAFIQHDHEQLCKGQGRQRQVKALESGRRNGHHHGQHDAQGDTAQDCQWQRQTHLEQQDQDGISTDAIKREMGKRHLAGDAEQKVVAQRQGDPQQQFAVDVGLVGAQHERQRRQQQRGGQVPGQCLHARASRASNRPVGRSSRNPINNTSGTPIAMPGGTGA